MTTVATTTNSLLWVLRTREHWLRCDHRGTALDPERNAVSIARRLARRAANAIAPGDPAQLRYGAAIDRAGRIWRSVPGANRLERIDAGGIHALGGPAATPG